MNTSVRQTPRLCISAYLFIYYTLTHIYCTLTHAYLPIYLSIRLAICMCLCMHRHIQIDAHIYIYAHTNSAHISTGMHLAHIYYTLTHAISTYLLHTYTCISAYLPLHIHIRTHKLSYQYRRANISYIINQKSYISAQEATDQHSSDTIYVYICAQFRYYICVYMCTVQILYMYIYMHSSDTIYVYICAQFRYYIRIYMCTLQILYMCYRPAQP